MEPMKRPQEEQGKDWAAKVGWPVASLNMQLPPQPPPHTHAPAGPPLGDVPVYIRASQPEAKSTLGSLFRYWYVTRD